MISTIDNNMYVSPVSALGQVPDLHKHCVVIAMKDISPVLDPIFRVTC